MSYADRHKAKYAGVAATKPALVAGMARPVAASPRPAPVSPVTNQYMAGLEADLLRLKQVASREDKHRIKRTDLLPRYLPYVHELEQQGDKAAIVAAGRIVFYCLVWSLDGQDWPVAIDLAGLMGKYGISSFDDFSRTPANIVAGQMASWCNEQHAAGRSAEPALSLLLPFSLIYARTLLEPIMADIAKASGGEAELQGDHEGALLHYRQALSFNPNAGVKRNISRLEKLLSAANQDAVPAEPGQGEQDDTGA